MDNDFKELERKWLKRKKRKEYYETHKDTNKKYRENNREKLRMWRRKHYAKHRVEMLRKRKIYFATHPIAEAKRKENAKKWQKEHPEKYKAYLKKYYYTHPEKSLNRYSKTVCGVECFCGFQIKCHSRNTKRKKVRCPNCKKSYFPCDLKKITIQRDSYQSVFDIQKKRSR